MAHVIAPWLDQPVAIIAADEMTNPGEGQTNPVLKAQKLHYCNNNLGPEIRLTYLVKQCNFVGSMFLYSNCELRARTVFTHICVAPHT